MGSMDWRHGRFPPVWQSVLVVEEFSRACGGLMLLLSAHHLGCMSLLLSGDLNLIRRLMLPVYRPKTRRWIYSENTPPTITCWWAGPIWSAGARASLPMSTIATLWCSLMAPFGLPSPRYQGELMGEAQIIDHTGNRLARRHPQEGPGVITADLELTPGEPSLETPERFWIPELAWRFRFF